MKAARPDAVGDDRLVTDRPGRAWTVLDVLGRMLLIGSEERAAAHASRFRGV